MSCPEFLFCPLRKEAVAALPEEKVRQRLLTHMMTDLGFPPTLIVVEKSLRQLPHLTAQERLHIPDRRADVICFAKGIHPSYDLYPLLTVECKAVPLTPRVISQVVGYNHFVKACFIAMVNQDQLKMGWFDPVQQQYVFLDYLPTYQALLKRLKYEG